MRVASGVCCALAAQGAMGFIASPSLRSCERTRILASARVTQPSQLQMSTTSPPRFTLSLMDDTRVSFDMGLENVEKLAREVNNALSAFKRLKANAVEGKRPYREDTIMYRDDFDGLHLVVECNPNIFPDPFKAQVFVRVWDDRFEISSQAMLTKLTDAIKLHMTALKAQQQ